MLLIALGAGNTEASRGGGTAGEGRGGRGPAACAALCPHTDTQLPAALPFRCTPPLPLPWHLPPLQCVQSCCTKFMKHSARMGLRFGELSSEAESQMQQMMQQGGGK